MFNSGNHAAEGPAEPEGKSPFEPLLNTVGEYSGKFLEDEEFKEALGEVLDEILADERLAGYDTDALVVRTLRDERLVNILGGVIARHLREEEFQGFVEQLAYELKTLMKDPAIVSYLHNTITGFLKTNGSMSLYLKLSACSWVSPSNLKAIWETAGWKPPLTRW